MMKRIKRLTNLCAILSIESSVSGTADTLIESRMIDAQGILLTEIKGVRHFIAFVNVSAVAIGIQSESLGTDTDPDRR